MKIGPDFFDVFGDEVELYAAAAPVAEDAALETLFKSLGKLGRDSLRRLTDKYVQLLGTGHTAESDAEVPAPAEQAGDRLPQRDSDHTTDAATYLALLLVHRAELPEESVLPL